VEYPNNMPLEAVDLIDKLMHLNPLKRLGVGEKGSGLDFEALKSHEFFKGLNFKRIEEGLIKPPIPVEMFDQILNEDEKAEEEEIERELQERLKRAETQR